MTWNGFIHRAIGVPFVPHGRRYDGWDCWGLVWRGYRDVLGIELSCYSDQYDQVKGWRRIHRLFLAGRSEWRQTDRPSTGDVAMIYRRGLPIHVGLMIQEGRRVLHVEEGVETIHEPIGRFRIEGFYKQPGGEK